MDPLTIGFLHPGEMGVSLAATALRGGHRGLWASEGRGPATRDRATEHGLSDAVSVGALCAHSDLVVSICPPHAAEVAAAFAAGPLETEVLGPELGTASVVKMAYASVTTGTTALLVAALAAAEGHGVRDALLRQWDLDEPGAGDARGERVRRVTRKAWRFAGEMQEIAATFEAAGVPGGFHAAAAETYRRLEGFRGAAELPALAEVLAAAAGGGGPAAAAGGGRASTAGHPQEPR